VKYSKIPGNFIIFFLKRAFFPGFTGGSAFEEAKNRLFSQSSSIRYPPYELLDWLEMLDVIDSLRRKRIAWTSYALQKLLVQYEKTNNCKSL
jgi:hypothetical protein